MISEPNSYLGASIVRTARLLVNSVNSHLLCAGNNITFEQLEVLIYLSANPGRQIIQTDLAIRLQKNKSGVLRTLDVLQKKHFVKRNPVTGDRRKNVIELTTEGYLMAKEAMAAFDTLEQGLMSRLTEEEVLVCARVLEQIKTECGPVQVPLCNTQKETSPLTNHRNRGKETSLKENAAS